MIQKLLDELVSQHDSMLAQLQQPVGDSLEKLRDVLLLLHHITDLQHVVDEKFLPVEQQYAMLRSENPLLHCSNSMSMLYDKKLFRNLLFHCV